jgi:nucleoside-diphosphate-sugar epimerase
MPMIGFIAPSIPLGLPAFGEANRMSRVLIAGCGYVGAALGERLIDASHEVWGLRRKPRSLPEGIEPIEGDLIESQRLDLPDGLDFVAYLASPIGSEDAHYRRVYVDGVRALIQALEDRAQRPRLLLATSTAVYGQTGGEWVDESSETAPRDFRGARLLEGERIALGGALPATVIRFGGIYGPRRTGLVDRVRAGRAVYRAEPPRYTNRIHRDDCAGALQHLMELEAPDSIYVAVDQEPVEERIVLRWLAGALGSSEPRSARAGEGRSSASNKRCRNDRLLRAGYIFRYPTFREGYRAVLEDLA